MRRLIVIAFNMRQQILYGRGSACFTVSKKGIGKRKNNLYYLSLDMTQRRRFIITPEEGEQFVTPKEKKIIGFFDLQKT